VRLVPPDAQRDPLAARGREPCLAARDEPRLCTADLRAAEDECVGAELLDDLDPRRTPSVPSSNASGRRPSTSDEAPFTASLLYAPRARAPNETPPFSNANSQRFIAGDPMKPATKRLPGRS
jgi:hypothetical protein